MTPVSNSSREELSKGGAEKAPTLQRWSLLESPEKGRMTLMVPPCSTAVLHLGEKDIC